MKPIPMRRKTMRIGFVSLLDAAPILVASDLGFFSRYGLNVELSREIGWGTVEDKIAYGELEAAHATCPMLFSRKGSNNPRSNPCLTGIILNRGGNAIVLASDLWRRGVRDSKTLKTDIFHRRHFRKYIFATVHNVSTHSITLRKWLTKGGIDPARDIQLVTLPPNQMYRNLEAGTIEGFCAGEPWPSLAISRNLGWSPATSVEISPNHPEKALMVTKSFAKNHREEHLALIAALKDSCYYCQQPENREQITQILISKNRINCPADILKKCLKSKFDYGNGNIKTDYHDYLRFSGPKVNRPRREDERWALENLSPDSGNSNGYCIEDSDPVFREDIYEEALRSVATHWLKTENF